MLSDIITWNKVLLEVHSSATEIEIKELWEMVREIDSTLMFDKRYRKHALKEHPKATGFHHSLLPSKALLAQY